MFRQTVVRTGVQLPSPPLFPNQLPTSVGFAITDPRSWAAFSLVQGRARFEEQVIGVLQSPRQLPGNVQDEQGEQYNVFVAQFLEQFFGKYQDFAVRHGHGGEIVLVDADQRHMPEAFAFAKALLLDVQLLVRNEQVDGFTLDEVDVRRVIVLLEDVLSPLERANFEAADDLALLGVGEAAEHGDFGQDGGDGPGVSKR